MAENFVPDVDFKLANFKNFVEARRKLIRSKLEENLKAHGVIYSAPPARNLFIDVQELKITDAVTDADGKIILTILYEQYDPLAYVYNKNYEKILINIKFAYKLIEDGRAVKIPPDEFNAMQNNSPIDDKQSARELKKIIDMATRIKKQFANAAVTKDGKFMFYADHAGVRIGPGAPNWNPSFYVVNEDLLTPRVSLDIMLQEIVSQNLFVEITKADVDEVRRTEKSRGKTAAFNYLESITNNS